ncbi:GNAT family N-acetyltransferase [Salipaludibacillus daqingensis]|uniref:GNAT family N-acetyltransferase n=1 Tax=Salipaludibacillus daqingensis TaxID=3041001 RepID=UPI002476E0DF|nr:GNAT family N-acetyltransferase [Salipaludibacillus daqingensis]
MIKIRLARIKDLQRILYILNETTFVLKQKGMNQWNDPWDENKITDQIINNNSYVFILNNEIVGTFCIHKINNINELSVEPESKYLSQIAMLPTYQGRNLGSKITDYACSLVRGLNKSLYLDCWSGNKKLKEFYTNSGLEYIGDFPEEDYFISIFRYN